MCKTGILVVVLLLQGAFISYGQKLVLPGGQLQFKTLPADSIDPIFHAHTFFEGAYYYAAYLSGTRPNTRTTSPAPFHTGEKLAPSVYLVQSTFYPDLAANTSRGIVSVAPLPGTLKTDMRIRTNQIPAYALAGKDVVKISVGLYRNVPSQAALKALAAAGLGDISQRWILYGIVEGTLNIKKVEELAALPFVTAVRLQPPADKILNHIYRGSAGASLAGMPAAWGGTGLRGEGITIGIGDDADPTLHPDIADRVINHTPGIPNNHGTHVSATAAGAGLLQYRRAGFAPAARVVSQWFSGIWTNAATYATEYNMVVTNNSYGSIAGDCDYAGVYDLYSRLLDEQALLLPQMLHVFAAGNDGDNTCAPYPLSYQTVLGGYQSAKNIITAGRTDYTQLASGSSSSGPVKDGRLKPEITGLGIITSANGAGTGYFTDYGTSMSAPGITGGLALLYQQYRQLSGGINPPGALMKALLLNGARDVGIPGPDFRHGYGTMMLNRSLRMLRNGTFTTRTISQAATSDTTITISAGIAQLKVLLYWHDPAAGVLSGQTLVHDLDLEVIGPGGTTVYPLVANPASVTQPAQQGQDHINNHEQVVIAFPVAGNYTLRVKGTEILTAPEQAFALVFDEVPSGISFTHPVRGSLAQAGSFTLPVAWEDEGTASGDYALDYSTDNGNTWNNIVTGLKDTTRLYFWEPGAVRSPHARLRITKGSTIAVSDSFAIIPNLTFSAAASVDQCLGYFRINWTPLTATAGENIRYKVLLKKGAVMDTIADLPSGANTFTLSGLSPDSLYYAAVIASINGMNGAYNAAVSRRPNGGNCNGTISDGNLMLDSIMAPLSGRAFTASALGNAATISIRIRNTDNTAASSFAIRYNVNGGPFTEAVINTPVAARSTYTHHFPGNDFSATGTYTITAVVTNLAQADPVQANDTLRHTFFHIPNPPIDLSSPLTEGFEQFPALTLQRPATGIAGLTRWDYVNEDPLARLRTFVHTGIARTGNRAITLDVSKATPRVQKPFNQLIGTFNLAAYDTGVHAVRLGFSFAAHGSTQTAGPQNMVWARGRETDPWIPVFDLGAAQSPVPGQWVEAAGISLADSLAKAGQPFSQTTQIRFGQYALYSMADKENFGGYSFDDIRLFIAENDAALLSVVGPESFRCATGASAMVTVQVQNNMSSPLSSVPVRYRINNDPWIDAIIPHIPARTAILFTFPAPAHFPAGKFDITAAVQMPGDNIAGNNSITSTIFHQPVISSFPWYQDFESSAGEFTTDGLYNSWAYGTPASWRIKGAASGTRAWKTRLTGDYNNREKSYLYSPCFDISTLSNPMLGFSLAYSIEDCRNFNLVCDAGWMEYTIGGTTWLKLGSFGQGQNWYDYETGQVWMKETEAAWREAIIPVPAHNGIIRFRFVFSADDGSTRDGIAIDNFHIYNGGALPLRWMYVNASPGEGRTAILQWQVADEENNGRYDIQMTEYEFGNNLFQDIGSLPARAAARGNYQFRTTLPEKAGTWFFRIIHRMPNGDSSVSPIRRLLLPDAPQTITLYPNPGRGIPIVSAFLPQQNGPVTLQVYNAAGKVLLQQTLQVTGQRLRTLLPQKAASLAPGLYRVVILGGTTRLQVQWLKQ